MSAAKVVSENYSIDKKLELDQLDPLFEVNENVTSEIFDRPNEELQFEEISPKIFGLKDVSEPLTIESLNNAIYELGVINLCWPEINEPVFETRTCFPKSYFINTNKERLLLAYAENFRRQFQFHYRSRRPLFLQAPNECGLQKMVCTSIRPTKLCYSDTTSWQGLSSLVSDYFDYEPLRKPMLHPERIISAYTAIVRRSGNPFELAHVLVSWLIGAGYDAYVVVGCAKRDVCMAIRYRTVCPEIPDESEVIDESPPSEEEPRYRLVPLPDLTSKYCKDMDRKEAEKQQAELNKIESERLKKIAELEKPPPDEIDGWRTHAWVLVLPGFKGVEEPFFIEPSEGNGYPISAPQYQQLDSIYNNENYYVNLQSCAEGLGSLNYDLNDLTCWEHLLAGEPFHRRQLVGIDCADKKTAFDTEKHLDVPTSWIEKLDITADEYEQRYPGSHKVIRYKKVLSEKFSPYSERDGVIKRIIIYEDYALSIPLLTYEWYKNRVDKMLTVKIDHLKREVREIFGIGRKDHLLKHIYSMDAPTTSVEGERTLEFNYYARLDHLTKLVCTALTFDEYYTDREDRLETRFITYTEGNKFDPKRQVKDIIETYSRNPDIPSKDDIWKKIFHTQENTIEILYHYDYNFVTNNTRFFIKPNLAETGGKILFYPDKTSGYIADPCTKPPRPLDVYYALCDNMESEHHSRKHIRDRESDITGYLKQRECELTEPVLFVGLFDTERNDAAKKGWQEQEAQKAEVTEREKDAEIDPLAPYLARMFGSGHGAGALTVKEATLVREQCLNDFRAKQLARQNLVQERFDKLNAEYKNKRLWYLANQFILTPEKESAYFALSAELAFQVHTLEVRLTRHRDLSSPRFKALEDYLDKHPLLKEFNRLRHYYRMK
ncbi:dynein regulatory complex subunit 7 [Vanessa atalanta]|uniref:dynein regulatory complex subunit 7 n=1 Tax=Vanessa atalanta TaxID=42275 RepID=UPI001FCE2119|nr:dynein regulatory complex subunit 7 [Vanessa atalanta]